LTAAAIVGATVWGVQAWKTNRALASVEGSLAGRPLAPPAPQAPGVAAPAQAGNGQAEPVDRTEVVGTVPAPTDRLPPLVLPGQPVAAAVLRGEEDIRRIGTDALLISDTNCIQFLVRNQYKLDKHSRKILDRFL
jgi:hypothetical protein